MAEVRHCLRSGAKSFQPIMCHHHVSSRPMSTGDNAFGAAVHPAYTGFVANLDFGLGGTHRVRAGGSRDCYTRLRHPTFSYGDISQTPSCHANRRDWVPDRIRANIQRMPPLYGIGVNAWRSVSLRRGWRSSDSGGHVTVVRPYSGNGAGSEPLHKSKTGYYDILEVQPAATQAQIKTAYYKQSFIYHPDRNCGSDEATVRFSEISEAYTVLGNKSLRRKYDRGLLTLSDLSTTRKPSGRESSGRPQSRQAAVSSVERRIDDFDSFFKSHYSEQLQREKDIRARREELHRKKEKGYEMNMSYMMEVSFVIILLLAVGAMISVKKS